MDSVLDIGYGSGTWALAMAKELPGSQVVAADITPPDINAFTASGVEVPSNLTVVKANAEEAWPFKQHLTYIHARMLISAISDWQTLLQRCWDHLQPGGWLELNEVVTPYRAESPTFDNRSSPFIEWGHLINESWASEGLDFTTTAKQVQRLEQLGFVNAREERMRWPVGEWADTEIERHIGAMTLQNHAIHFTTNGPRILAKSPNLKKHEAEIKTSNAHDDIMSNSAAKRYFLTVQVLN